MTDKLKWSYGLELELGSIDTRKGLPEGFVGFSDQEHDLVAVTGPWRGLPNDPKRKIHPYSGELNTQWTYEIDGQVQAVRNALTLYPEASINHRYDLHCHIGAAEFKTDVDVLKRILTYIRASYEDWIKLLYTATKHGDMTKGDYAFYNTNAKNMPDWRYENCMNAKTVEEFLYQHQTDSHGKYNPRMTTRYYANMFAVRDHGTIEFRAFWPSLNPDQVGSNMELLRRFCNEALADSPREFYEVYKEWLADGFTVAKEQPFDAFCQASWRYCSKRKDMMERWEEFKRLWEEDQYQFYKDGWWKDPKYGIKND